MFCIFAGPFYKYHIYQDWLRQENPDEISLLKPFLAKAKNLPFIAVAYLVFSFFFNIKVYCSVFQILEEGSVPDHLLLSVFWY